MWVLEFALVDWEWDGVVVNVLHVVRKEKLKCWDDDDHQCLVLFIAYFLFLFNLYSLFPKWSIRNVVLLIHAIIFFKNSIYLICLNLVT